MKHQLKKFYNLFRNKIKAHMDKPFRPDLTDEYFIASLAGESPLVQEAKRALSRNNIEHAQSLIVKHFRERLKPRFFLDIAEVPMLVESIGVKYPQWRDRTIQSAQNMILNGVSIYNIKSLPLDDENVWIKLSAGPGQDVLYQVRLHRFGFAPQFVLAAHYGLPTLSIFDRLIDRWEKSVGRDHMPYLSNLTVISRIISLSWAWIFLSGLDQVTHPEKSNLEYRLLRIIHSDSVFLSRREHQSALNNHKIVYGFSRLYISILFPEFVSLKEWASQENKDWLSELKRQIYIDGGGFEPTLHYHQFTCECLSAYILLCRQNLINVDFCFEELLDRVLSFQVLVSGPDNIPLRIGDSSEHSLFSLNGEEGWGIAGFRELYRSLFSPNLMSAQINQPSVEKAFWLLGGRLEPLPPPGCEEKESKFYAFHDSGYYLFNNENPRTRLIFRTGPSIESNVFAGHMHADLLSVYVIVDGVPFIVNSGTYTYRSNVNDWPPGTPAWRKFFMGPESKNTVFIDNEDSLGAINGDFRDPTTKVRVKTTISYHQAEINWIEAEIIGAGNYSHFRRGVIHLMNNYWVVYDVKGADNAVVMGLQLAEKVEFERYDNSIVMLQDSEYLNAAWSSSLNLGEKMKGSLSPLGGWVSEKYGEMKAATYLKFKVAIDKKLSACVFIAGENLHPVTHVQESQFDPDVVELAVKSTLSTDYIFYRSDGCSGRIQGDKVALNANAAMLFIRFDMNNEPLFIKALNVINVSLPEIGLTMVCKNAVPWLDLSLVDRCNINDGNILVEWKKSAF